MSFCHCALLWHHFLPFLHQLILPTGLSLWALAFAAFFLEKFCQSLACICEIWPCFSCHCMCSCCMPFATVISFSLPQIYGGMYDNMGPEFVKGQITNTKFCQPYWMHFYQHSMPGHCIWLLCHTWFVICILGKPFQSMWWPVKHIDFYHATKCAHLSFITFEIYHLLRMLSLPCCSYMVNEMSFKWQKVLKT